MTSVINRRNINNVVQPLLTDMYQLTMAYAYWKSNKQNQRAVFDLFFRKNPFGGEYTVFAGLDECLRFLDGFKYSQDDINYIRKILPDSVEKEFFEYLSQITAKDVTLYAISEGTVVFPKVPLLRVEGPLPIVQLLETTLLNLVNYSSLVTTNSVRFRLAAGKDVTLLEFGLRRAQGPDGGLSASKYAYIGGFDGTSNVLAGKLYGIPVKGTHAHAFIMSYSSLDDLETKVLRHKVTNEEMNFVDLCVKYQKDLAGLFRIICDQASTSELAAFIAYAIAFPNSFLALVDTYDVIRSGLLNFCAVTLALNDLGYKALGIRIDSGDLAYQSDVAYNIFKTIEEKYNLPWFSKLTIIASNDINEATMVSLNEQTHKINSFGIGTHLVTCQRQPALGCVYKLVEIEDHPCIKLSLDIEKVTIPGRKSAYRLYGQEGYALLDIMLGINESEPEANKRILCRHPFQEAKRCYATPRKIEPLLNIWWKDGKITRPVPTLNEIRNRVRDSINSLRPDIKRQLNPTPYKVSVSDALYSYMHELWLENAPIGELQ